MTNAEIIDEIKKLEKSKKLELAQTILQLVRQDIEAVETPAPETIPESVVSKVIPRPPLQINVVPWNNWPADSTFSREDIYEDDDR